MPAVLKAMVDGRPIAPAIHAQETELLVTSEGSNQS